MNKKHFSKIQLCIETKDPKKLRRFLRYVRLTELLEIIDQLTEKEQLGLFEILSDYFAIKCLKVLPIKTKRHIMKHIDHHRAAKLLNAMPDDDRITFFEELPGLVVNELIKVLDEKERNDTLTLLGYPEGSVGRLMTPHYVAVKKEWTVKQVFEFIKHNGQNSETVNVIYVVDDEGILIDDIRIREFLFVDDTKLVSEVMDGRYLSLLVTDKEEESIEVFKKNNRFALPVTDKNNILLGIVTIDDVLRLAEETTTEDIQKMGGSEALDEPYTQISFINLIKKRAGWLVILFLGEMLTASAMGHFEGEISKAVVLALFIPLIISSGGNSGSQASSIIIRAMALGEVKLKDWFYVMRKEIFSGVVLGIILGTVGFIRIAVWQQLNWGHYGEHWLLVAITIFFSLIGIVLWGTISGSMLPMFLKRLGADPAASSAPFVATLVDVTGLIIYFSIAYVVMQGTLL